MTQQDLLAGNATTDQMALWRVVVSGTAISAPEKLFESVPNLGNVTEHCIPSTRRINGYMLDEDITLNAEDVEAVNIYTKVNGKELTGDITLGRLDFELSIKADAFVPGDIVLEPSIALCRNFFAEACFFRMYFKNAEPMTAGTEYTICSFAGDFAPSARHALACYGLVDAAAVVLSDGTVRFRPRADVPANYSLYVSGCWMK
jgi:hypothetical protein